MCKLNNFTQINILGVEHYLYHLGAIHKLGHMNYMILLPFPVLVTGGYISEIPLPSVTSHILQLYTYKLLN